MVNQIEKPKILIFDCSKCDAYFIMMLYQIRLNQVIDLMEQKFIVQLRNAIYSKVWYNFNLF